MTESSSGASTQNTDTHHIVALDLGGTKINAAHVAITSDDASVVTMRKKPTPHTNSSADIVSVLLELTQEILDTMPDDDVEAIGLSTGGVVDSTLGLVVSATGTINDWAGTDLHAAFSKKFDIPFFALNDAHAHALGEATFGAGKDASSMLMVAVGTGIGGALVINNELVQGAHFTAGHIGHIGVTEAEGTPCTCGRTGHLEGYAAGPAVVRMAHENGLPESVTEGADVAKAARSGDEAAVKAYRASGYATGRVIGSLLNTFDPELVTLAGGVTESCPQWLEAVHEGVKHDAMDIAANTPIVRATAGSEAALLGAGQFALKQLASTK